MGLSYKLDSVPSTLREGEFAVVDGVVYVGDENNQPVKYISDEDTDVSGASWVLDEDNFASDSNTKVPTQQSAKKYVDDKASLATLNVLPFAPKNVHVVSGVIRYYSSFGRWDLLENNEANPHPSINIDSITSNENNIQIHFDNSKFGLGTDADIEVGSFIIAPDETLASEGIICGSSVNFEKATVELYKGPRSDYIEYDGSNWTVAQGNFSTPTWDTDHLNIPRSFSGAFVPTYPQITERHTPATSPAVYRAVLGSVSQSEGNIEVWFYDQSGNVVTSPSTNMRFFISDHNRSQKVDPNNFDSSYGNLWFYGWLSSGHA